MKKSKTYVAIVNGKTIQVKASDRDLALRFLQLLFDSSLTHADILYKRRSNYRSLPIDITHAHLLKP